MPRNFLHLGDLHHLVTDVFGTGRRLRTLRRLTGGTRKGVYRLELDDRTTVVLYAWTAAENYWPPAPDGTDDDPFTDASGADLFATNHAALTDAGVRVPRLLMLDRDGRYLDADTALVEDAGTRRLQDLLTGGPAAAAAPLDALGTALRGMHTTHGPRPGRLTDVARGPAGHHRDCEDIVVDRALRTLDAAATRDPRLADAHDRIAAHVRHLRAAVTVRRVYALVHGELGPDHVLVTPAGEPVVIDVEGLTYFDVEWDHAWLRMRFGAAYPALRPVGCDPRRLELYRYAQVLSLIEGPLRLADTDFPSRRWMRDLAERNIVKALAVL
ncbi:aminoglycoside phosphotransferase [Micromonospora echinofusca]|uniref:Aminoglycoside phosphotransferase n=1 Tax=Micromonospora echinofusca TaxID=47858 RepID=A0ABS3VSB5_MICEH|nr:aminoglycoside phosphotransferase [Micromonospora echinofusca]MBO4207411.1 aminoglycoside phosphotransferase [Micromonospora echinofusca]